MTADKSHGFWHVLAVFFPAVTGILSGVGMSGDLKKPSRSLPLGTIAAVLTGWVIYMSVPIALDIFVSDKSVLLTDSMIMQKCARIPWLIVAGVWAASLSSALGGLLAAPRVLQALSNDGALPSFIGKGYGKTNDPYIASVLGMSLAGIGIWYGDVNLLAPILTIFNLTAYALLNLSAAFEEFMGNPSWRPSFRVPSIFSFLGFVGCVGMMFMISPGATIAAVIGICIIWFVMSRRTMHARWGDMRTGLLVYLVHVILRRIAKRSAHTHAWRPNLLVLSGTPDRRLRIVEFVRTVTGAMSFATFGIVVPTSSWNISRGVELSNMMKAWLVRHGVDAQVRVIPGDNLLQGRGELTRTYGYGPLEPNTILLGEMPDLETAKMLNLLVSLKRNAILMRSEKGALLPIIDNQVTIDVWWRGKSSNAAFVLAFAYLLQRGTFGKPAKLRLCHLAETGEKSGTVKSYLDNFISEIRIKAEVVIVPPSNLDLYEKITEISKASSLVFLGLRTPRKDEPVEAYAAYFNALKEKTTSLPQAIFACAAEDVDFKSIFKE